jgi:hypothetical protein
MTNIPRFGLTKAGVVIAIFIGVVAVALVVLALRTPVTESFQDWIYPNSSSLATITNSEVLSAVYTTPDDLTNVMDWYSDRLRIGKGGNPSFSYRSRGLFARGISEQAARIGNALGTNATESFLIWRPDRALIVHASWNRKDLYTTISITTRETLPATNSTFSLSTVQALTPPSSLLGAGGQTMNVAAHALTDTNSFTTLRQFWDQPSALATNTVNARGRGGVATSEFSRAQVVRLPVGAAAKAMETDLIFITPNTLSLIHVAEGSNSTRQVVIGSITR